MRVRNILVPVMLGAFVLTSPGSASAQEAEFTYVGERGCRRCHNKEETGAQATKWQEGPHSKTFETLAGEKAAAVAAELGLGNPQEEAQCLSCHATAFAVMEDLDNQRITLEEGVSCESCHGPGSAYRERETKDAIAAGEIDPASVGLLRPTEATCTKCHKAEGNPSFEGFDFEEYAAKIAHPNPEKAGG